MDTTKIMLVSQSLDKIASSISSEPSWVQKAIESVVPIIIGALLTLTIQWILDHLNHKKENRKEIKELVSLGKAKELLLAHKLRDLAMYKTHKQYYYRLSQILIIEIDKDDVHKKHYEKGQEQRQVESEIDVILSEYFQIITKYDLIVDSKIDFDSYQDEIFGYTFDKASNFLECKTSEDAVVFLKKEEERLNESYKIFLKKIGNIQKIIQSDSKKHL